MEDTLITYPLLTQATALELGAIDRFIAEDRPDLSRGEAGRLLISEALKHMGLLGVR